MPLVFKDCLYPGRFRLSSGAWVDVSTQDTADAEANVRKCLARGVNIPGCWLHYPIEAKDMPMSRLELAKKLRDWARSVWGHVVYAQRDAECVLWLGFQVRDPADVAQLRKTRFVSPMITYRYVDAAGNSDYRGMFIPHVAATPMPVQMGQRPFE